MREKGVHTVRIPKESAPENKIMSKPQVQCACKNVACLYKNHFVQQIAVFYKAFFDYLEKHAQLNLQSLGRSNLVLTML